MVLHRAYRLKFATSLSDLYDQLAESERVELLRGVFGSIVLGAEGVVGFTRESPFDRIVSATTKAAAMSERAQGLATAIVSSVEAES